MLNIIAEKLADLSIEELKKQRTFCLFMGVLFLVVGFVCLISPITSSIVISIFVGWLFLFGGILQCVGAVLLKKYSNVWTLILGILIGFAYIFIGHQFIVYPVMGVVLLSLFVGTLFIASGVTRGITLFVEASPQNGRGGIVLMAVLEVLLGVLIVSDWPGNFGILLAVLLSVQLFLSSGSYFSLAALMAKMVKEKTQS